MKEVAEHPGSAGPIEESVYWRRTRRLTGWLLALWLVVTLLATMLPTSLDFGLFGWPFSFWFGAQGALLLFLGIVFVYVWRMEALEQPASVDPSPPPPPST